MAAVPNLNLSSNLQPAPVNRKDRKSTSRTLLESIGLARRKDRLSSSTEDVDFNESLTGSTVHGEYDENCAQRSGPAIGTRQPEQETRVRRVNNDMHAGQVHFSERYKLARRQQEDASRHTRGEPSITCPPSQPRLRDLSRPSPSGAALRDYTENFDPFEVKTPPLNSELPNSPTRNVVDKKSFRPGSSMSSINNPRLIEIAEDSIRRFKEERLKSPKPEGQFTPEDIDDAIKNRHRSRSAVPSDRNVGASTAAVLKHHPSTDNDVSRRIERDNIRIRRRRESESPSQVLVPVKGGKMFGNHDIPPTLTQRNVHQEINNRPSSSPPREACLLATSSEDNMSAQGDDHTSEERERKSSELHQVYNSKGEIPYTHVDYLGNGTFGYVDKVEHRTSSKRKHYARKIIRSSNWDATQELEAIQNEVTIIKRLSHRHIARLVCTYQFEKQFCIIMLPVADCHLGDFLSELDKSENIAEREQGLERIWSWYGCLAQAIEYLHKENVRHKDVKPANILVKGKNIYITDFGIAKDLVGEDTTASIGTPGARSPMYCAPEVSIENHRRGRKADIFSLGCIFLEMTTVLYGASLRRFQSFRINRTTNKRAYAANMDKVLQWMVYLAVKHERSEIPPEIRKASYALFWAFSMLDPEPDCRPSAQELTRGMQFRYHEDMSCFTGCSSCAFTHRAFSRVFIPPWLWDLEPLFCTTKAATGVLGPAFRVTWGECKARCISKAVWLAASEEVLRADVIRYKSKVSPFPPKFMSQGSMTAMPPAEARSVDQKINEDIVGHLSPEQGKPDMSPPNFGVEDEGYPSTRKATIPTPLNLGVEGQSPSQLEHIPHENFDAYDPFVGAAHSKHDAVHSQGIASPMYESVSRKGLDRIASKDIVSLMDHLTIRDAERNARDTEILVTLVRNAAEMRNSYEDMRRFVQEQDALLAATGTFVFKWPHAATEVYVTGTFDDWAKTVRLEKKGDVFEKEITLPNAHEKYLYKFVVDGNWTTDPNSLLESDDSNQIHNVVLPRFIKKRVPAPRPQPPMDHIQSASPSARQDDHAGISNERGNIFKRALEGLSGKSSNDLGKIEEMLLNLLGDVEGLKKVQGGAIPPSQPDRPIGRPQFVESDTEACSLVSDEEPLQRLNHSPINETDTPKSISPGPIESPTLDTIRGTEIRTDLATVNSRRKKDRSRAQERLGIKDIRDTSQTSLLIEYFEGGRSGPKTTGRPSVRVKVTPSAEKKHGNPNDHIQIAETDKSRKPFPRRISLEPRPPKEMSSEDYDSASSGSPLAPTLAREYGHRTLGAPPVEAEVLPTERRGKSNPPDLQYFPPPPMATPSPPETFETESQDSSRRYTPNKLKKGTGKIDFQERRPEPIHRSVHDYSPPPLPPRPLADRTNLPRSNMDRSDTVNKYRENTAHSFSSSYSPRRRRSPVDDTLNRRERGERREREQRLKDETHARSSSYSTRPPRTPMDIMRARREREQRRKEETQTSEQRRKEETQASETTQRLTTPADLRLQRLENSLSLPAARSLFARKRTWVDNDHGMCAGFKVGSALCQRCDVTIEDYDDSGYRF